MYWYIKSTCADVPTRVRRPAARSVSDEFTQSYTLARSPKGFFDVLYVDETMRVTRGNAGTVVVVER